jgi:paraquat-inducible protein B
MIRFDDGEGISVDQTEVLYKGISIGKVSDIKVAEDNHGVIATANINKDAVKYLRAETRFWLVKPRVSLAGVTGLETLVSGQYIAIQPGGGEEKRDFSALRDPPPLTSNLPGLHLTLKAERLGSLIQGSPVYYRQLEVGLVEGYQLGSDPRIVEVKIHIREEFAYLVRKHTRFYNASGISVSGGLEGFKVHSESIISLAAGGIAFFTPDNHEDSPPTNGSPFKLYSDYEAAEAGYKVLLHVRDVAGLNPERTPVMFNGVQVGTMKALSMNNDYTGATAELAMDPHTELLMNEGSEFWVVKPSISLAGVTGIDALVKGNYIAVRFAKKGHPAREFSIRTKAPPLNTDAPGLHLVLSSDRLNSVDIGSPILYRQMQVGSVQSYQLSRNQQQVIIGIHIEPEYASLINSSTRFWNASGVTLMGNLNGIQVKSESLQTLIAGGIAFTTPDFKAKRVVDVRRFNLFKDEDEAMRKGTLIELRLDNGEGIKPGTPLNFRGLKVGQVEDVVLADDLSGVRVKVRVTDAESRIACEGSQFWVVKPELGLLKTENLGTLVTGRYIEVAPAVRTGVAKTRFEVLSEAPNTLDKDPGFSLVLSASRRGSLKPGVEVSYKEIPVGKVTRLELSSEANRVLVHILIEPRYAPLVRAGTRFWNASGVTVDASLFRGVKLRSNSFEALLEGGIAFATPEKDMGKAALPNQTFVLFDEVEEDWLKWSPRIKLN